VTYRRRTIDETDQKVIEHVQEYGFVTNRTLQRLFDRDLFAARNMLSDLRERGLIEKLGTARGGPGVKYGPGPKFPKSKRPTDRSRTSDASSVADQLRINEE
jgi:ATP-dependent DNA helicase RecG